MSRTKVTQLTITVSDKDLKEVIEMATTTQLLMMAEWNKNPTNKTKAAEKIFNARKAALDNVRAVYLRAVKEIEAPSNE